MAQPKAPHQSQGNPWFEGAFLPQFRPVAIFALLSTLALIFAFQIENILSNWVAVLLLAIPITIQVYFNSGSPTVSCASSSQT